MMQMGSHAAEIQMVLKQGTGLMLTAPLDRRMELRIRLTQTAL